ncbi:hypothetical protein LEMLEM_LOCUS7820, partial [Lemmus lemmus]
AAWQPECAVGPGGLSVSRTLSGQPTLSPLLSPQPGEMERVPGWFGCHALAYVHLCSLMLTVTSDPEQAKCPSTSFYSGLLCKHPCPDLRSDGRPGKEAYPQRCQWTTAAQPEARLRISQNVVTHL